jgi:hypothetical protein
MSATGNLTTTEVTLASRARIPQTVVYRAFAHETVVLNLDTGLYHGLNPMGGQMLDTLAKAATIGAAADALASEYEAPLEELQRDLCAFCEALAERGLLVIEPV